MSLLKAYFGDAATEENDYGFGRLPKITGNHSHFPTMLRAYDGGLDGLFVMGQNPAVGSQHSGLQRRALAHLKWLVVRDLSELETATFWRDGPEVRSGEMRPEDIQTEVFLMPAASHVEKDGHFTNTQRLLQWHDKAIEPPGDARSELWFMHHLFLRVRDHYRGSTADRDWPIVNLNWDYPEVGEIRDPDAEAVLKEINGYDIATGEPVSGFARSRTTARPRPAAGSTPAATPTASTRRGAASPATWTPPAAGSRPSGRGPGPRTAACSTTARRPTRRAARGRSARSYVWWDEEQGKWTGYDVPDFPADKAPSYRPQPDSKGMDAIGGTDPFIMMADGKGWLYSPAGLMDGPMPTHYEPYESPMPNLLYPEVGCNPATLTWNRSDNPSHPTGDPRYPFVATTFRLTEHHTAGAMSRNLPWLAELQPEMFAEIDPILAAQRGIEDGGWMVIETARAEIEARARVTERMRPLRVEGREIHQIALPWHWGFGGASPGDSANDLGALASDPNVSIQEDKAFTCNVRAGRRTGETTSKLARVHEDSHAEPGGDAPSEDTATS